MTSVPAGAWRFASFKVDEQRSARRRPLDDVHLRELPVPRHVLSAVQAALRDRHLAGRPRRALPVRAQPGLVAGADDHHRRLHSRAGHDVDVASRSATACCSAAATSCSGDFFFSDGIYDPVQFVLTDRSGIEYHLDKRAGLLVDHRPQRQRRQSSETTASTRRPASSMSFVRDAANRITPDRRSRREHRLQLRRCRRPRPGLVPERHAADVHVRRPAQPADHQRRRPAREDVAVRRVRAVDRRSPTATATPRRSTATSPAIRPSSPTQPAS